MIAFAATFLIRILIGPITGASAVPSPFTNTDAVSSYFAGHHQLTAASAFVLLLASLPLLLFSAVVYSRLSFLAPNAPGPAIAGFGGLAASVLLALSAVVTWMLSRSTVTDQPALVHALHYLDFAAAGPGHTAALGVLVVGVAVTTIFLRRTPRVLSILGILLAALDVLSTITLVTDAAAPLIPIGRFASIAWLVVMSVLIPRERGARRPAVS